jgi:hypothetical protein
MPRYFFHLSRRGRVIPDPEGTDLTDIGEAQREAILSARDAIIRTLITDKPVSLEDSVQVVDEHGSLLLVVTFKEALG